MNAIYPPDYYVHPEETWDETRCQKVARQNPRNAFGDKEPWPGRVSAFGSAYCQPGSSQRYNGGCIRNGTWYQGEAMPLPVIPESWRFVTRSYWGIYLERVV